MTFFLGVQNPIMFSFFFCLFITSYLLTRIYQPHKIKYLYLYSQTHWAQFMYYVIHMNIQLRYSLLLFFVLMVFLMLFLSYLYLGEFISELHLVA